MNDDEKRGFLAGMEEAARICELRFSDHFDHSLRKVGAKECAERIRHHAAIVSEGNVERNSETP